MYEDIKKNKIKTGIIVTLFFTLVTLAIYAVCYMLDLGEFAIIFAMGVSIILTIATYYNCDKIVLMSVSASISQNFMLLSQLNQMLLLQEEILNILLFV